MRGNGSRGNGGRKFLRVGDSLIFHGSHLLGMGPSAITVSAASRRCTRRRKTRVRNINPLQTFACDLSPDVNSDMELLERFETLRVRATVTCKKHTDSNATNCKSYVGRGEKSDTQKTYTGVNI